MKILHLSTSDLDGGAARAAFRLHQGLRGLKVDSHMLVRSHSSAGDGVTAKKDLWTRLGPTVDGIVLKRYKNRNPGLFSPQWFPDNIPSDVTRINPDILHLHWVCNGYLKIETLPLLKKPLVWTLHDMWVFTGGCHYNKTCNRYKISCGKCPQLNSQREKDLSHHVLLRKQKAWKGLNLTIVAPSRWFADCAQGSSLLQNVPINIIPHGLDLTKYQPVPSAFARKLLNLPLYKKLVLFGAAPGSTKDPRKGLQLLFEALQDLGSTHWKDQIELAIFGLSKPDVSLNLPFPIHYLGAFKDDLSLSIVYSSADVMVVPSLQEAFGQTASESLACGTPVVAFNSSGLKDIVTHQQNGYLAQPFEASDLAQGIVWTIENDQRHENLRIHARDEAIQKFSLELQAKRHISLYQEIMKRTESS